MQIKLIVIVVVVGVITSCNVREMSPREAYYL